MYLPITSTFPLFVGGLIALVVHRRLHKDGLSGEVRTQRMRIGMLIACGLVAGSALMDVVLALSFSMLNGPDALCLVSDHWSHVGLFLGVVTMLVLALASFIFILLQKNLSMIKNKEWYFWDPLAAVIATDNSIAKFRDLRVKIRMEPEDQSGRIVIDEHNGDLVSVVGAFHSSFCVFNCFLGIFLTKH